MTPSIIQIVDLQMAMMVLLFMHLLKAALIMMLVLMVDNSFLPCLVNNLQVEEECQKMKKMTMYYTSIIGTFNGSPGLKHQLMLLTVVATHGIES